MEQEHQKLKLMHNLKSWRRTLFPKKDKKTETEAGVEFQAPDLLIISTCQQQLQSVPSRLLAPAGKQKFCSSDLIIKSNHYSLNHVRRLERVSRQALITFSSSLSLSLFLSHTHMGTHTHAQNYSHLLVHTLLVSCCTSFFFLSDLHTHSCLTLAHTHYLSISLTSSFLMCSSTQTWWKVH